MARKRYSEEDILRLLREIEVHLTGGMDVIIPIPRNSDSAGIPKLMILWFIPVKGDLSWVHLFHFALTLMPLDYVALPASAVITVRYDGCCHWQLFTTV